jgi:hypothetical protein
MKSERTRQGNQPVDWVDLVARIRGGDEEGVSRLREIFQGAIRFFLRRALGQHKLESRQKEVFDILITNLREVSIDNPNRLASYVLTLLRQYINSHITASPHLVSVKESNANGRVGPIRTMLANIAALDREALRRYYVDQETEEQICRALNITPARFRSLRNTTRAAVMSQSKESKHRSGLSK